MWLPNWDKNFLRFKCRRFSVSVALFFTLLFAFSPRLVAAQHIRPTAFVNVNVVPMDREIVLSHQTVVVEDGKIAALGPTQSVRLQVPANGSTAQIAISCRVSWTCMCTSFGRQFPESRRSRALPAMSRRTNSSRFSSSPME